MIKKTAEIIKGTNNLYTLKIYYPEATTWVQNYPPETIAQVINDERNLSQQNIVNLPEEIRAILIELEREEN